MANQIIQKVASGTSLVFKLRKLLFIFSISTIIFIVLVNAIVDSIEAKSYIPFIEDLGGKLLYNSVELERSSQQIIDRGGIFDFNNGLFKGLWATLLQISDILGVIIIIYYYIKFFTWIIDSTALLPKAVSILIAISGYMLLQIMFVLLLIANVIPNYFNLELSDNNLSNVFIPFRAFYTFFKTFPVFLSPIADRITDTNINLNKTININQTFNLSASM